MTNYIWQYINKRQFLKLTALGLVQQAIIALGTYALVEAGNNIQNSEVLFLWLGICVVTFVMPPFFAIVIKPLEARIAYAGYQNFLNEKLMSKAGLASIWTQKSQREVFLASIGPEAESYLAAIIFVWADLFSYVVSLVLGACVLGIAIDIKFVPSYLVSAVLSFIVYQYFIDKIKQLSEEDQNLRTKLSSFILKAWDNLFFNNKNLQIRYHKKFTENFNNSVHKSIQATCSSEIMIASLTLISALPVVIVIFWIAVKNLHSAPILIALLTTLPRQFNLLTTFRSIFQTMGSLVSFEAKFKSLWQNANISAEQMSTRINLDKILFADDKVSSMATFTQKIHNLPCGRYNIKAENGAGKSSLMIYLNTELPDSVFLPANPEFYLSDEVCQESTGQKMIRHFGYIANLEERIILLDEWDANLDSENTKRVNQKIEELSINKVVIEVRHKKTT